MKKVVILLLAVFFNKTFHGQTVPLTRECGNSIIDSIQRSLNSNYALNINAVNEQINDYISQNYNNNNNLLMISPTASFVIPVVVHIVRDPGDPLAVLTYSQVQSQIDALNAAFAKVYPTYNGQTHGPSSVDTKIQFCLANTPSGPANWTNPIEPGVMRYTNATHAHNQLSIASTNSLLTLTHPTPLYFPFNKYMNIWVVNSINGNCSGTQGYAVNPLGPLFGLFGFTIDGIVIRADAFGDNSTGNTFTLQPHNLYPPSCPTSFAQRNQGKVLVHEVGHYLNLWHTFQNDIITNATCAGATPSTCATSGDFCCDTPPSNVFSTHICGNPNPNSCGGPDQIENYMFYAFDPCWNTFTNNQTSRMWACLNIMRPNLFSLSNQIATGIIGGAGCLPSILYAGINISNPLCIPTNSTTTFSNPSGAFNTATSWTWSIPGGSPPSSNASSVTVAFSTVGVYTVSLTVSNGTATATNTLQVAVTSCSISANYLSQANWYFGTYGAINFSGGLPIPNNTAFTNTTINTSEGCITVSAPTSGALQFYSDGIRVWNNVHAASITGMPGNSSTSQYIAVPNPANLNQMYILIPPVDVGPQTNLISRLINVTPNVSSVSQATLPLQPSVKLSEVITVVPHCNNTDYWIITHGRNQTFYVYRLSNLGFTNGNLSGPLPDTYTFTAGAALGSLKASPNGQKLCLANWPIGPGGGPGGLYLYSFNNATGAISSQTVLSGSAHYGCSFSPNSNLVYATSSFNVLESYDLIANVSNLGMANGCFGVQIGPNGRLYVAPATANFLHSIDNPNNFANPLLMLNSVNFAPVNPAILSQLQLPNMIDAMPASVTTSISFAMTNCSTAAFNSTSCATPTTIVWNFGDGSPTVTGASPVHTYTASGVYSVTATFPPSTTVQIVVTIISPTINIAGATTVCINNNTPYIYTAPFVSGATYSWVVTPNGTIIGPNGSSQLNAQWNSGTSGIVSLTITNGGCISTGSLVVNINPSPTITAVASPTSVCISNPQTTLTASGGSSYVWQPGTIIGNPAVFSPSVNTIYTVTGSDALGCIGTGTVLVSFSVCPCPSCVNVLSGTVNTSPLLNSSYCINSDIIIQGAVNFSSSEFKIASGVKIIVDNGALLTINRSHLYACQTMWQGIVIKDASTNGPGTGRVIVENNSLVEDARYGVDIPGHLITSLPFGQYILSVKNSIFNKDSIGVRISNYIPTVSIQYLFNFQSSVFTSRNIPYSTSAAFITIFQSALAATAPNSGLPLASPYIDNSLYPPLAAIYGGFPQAGIVLQNVGTTINPTAPVPTYYEIKIGQNGIFNYNIFDHLITGIDAASSNFTSVNNFFQNTHTILGGGGGGPVGGIGINASAGSRRHNRIRVISGTPVGGFNNKFFDCSRAIFTSNYFEHHIKFCDVRSTQTNPAPFHLPLQQGKYGFYMTTNRFLKVDVSDNQLYNIENAITFNANYGFVILPPVLSTLNGQYSGQIDINRNIIQPHLTGFPVTTQYVENAIYCANVISTATTVIIPGTTVNQNANQIKTVMRGIYSANWANKDINTISNCITLIDDPFFFPSIQFGVNYSNNMPLSNYGNLIYNNSVTGLLASAFTNTLMHGTYESMSPKVYMRCNILQNTYSGVEFDGVPSNPGLAVGNKMQTHKYGFVLNNSAVTGTMGTPTAPIDNQWLGAWTVPNYKTAVAGGAISFPSPINVRPSPIQFNPNGSGVALAPSPSGTEYANPASIFYASGPLYQCPSGSPCPSVGPGPGGPSNSPTISASDIQTMEQIALDQITFAVNANESKFIGKNHLYRLLKANPSLQTSSPILQNFYTASQTTSREVFANIENDLSVGNVTNAQANISTFIPTNNIENNYKTYYGLYIKHLTDSTGLNTSDSTALSNLANLCPHTDGAVVYQARALYNSVFSTTKFFNDNCTAQNNNRFASGYSNANNSVADFNVIVFPNPTTGNINIAPFGLYEGVLNITAKDVTGKTVYNNDVTINAGNASFELDVKSGVYFITIINKSDGRQAVKKLIIQK